MMITKTVIPPIQERKKKRPEGKRNRQTEMISSETTMSIKNIIDKYPETKLLDQIKTRFKVNDIKSLTKEKGHKCLKMLIDYDKQHTEKE